MAILDNITVADAQLTSVFPSIDDYKFEGQSDFSDAIGIAKREVYREIRSKTGKTTTEMDKIRDTDQKNVLDKVVYLALSQVFLYNGAIELASEYKSKADGVAMFFHDDSDDDSVIDDGEESLMISATFGR